MNPQMDILFRYLIEDCSQQKQATLMNMYKCAMLAEKENRRRENEMLKKEIVSDVLSQLSVKADVTDAVCQIDALKNALQNLTNE